MTKLAFHSSIKIAKVDRGLGLVLGWGMISKVDGQPYIDTQNNYIPEDAMLDASVDFMKNSRMAKDMHTADGELPGEVLFAFPVTEDIKKAFGMTINKTGLMIAMRPDSDAILTKYETGEYTGFSIGGLHLKVTNTKFEDLV